MKTWTSGLVCSVLALLTTIAIADVAPTPPTCPKGKVVITTHRSAYCGDPAPTNCPPGWRGLPGDRCQVASCIVEDDCKSMNLGSCVSAKLCYRQSTRYQRGAKTDFDELIGISGTGAPCEAPQFEKDGKVCAPRGDTPTAFVPSPSSSAGPPRKGLNLATADDPATPRKSGCGACAAGATSDASLAGFWPGLLLIALACRRKRKSAAFPIQP